MAKRENPNEIPKKFRNLRGTILKDLKEKNSDSFKVFPKGLNFINKEREESIILIVRTPLRKYISKIAIVLLALVLPILIYLPISGTDGSVTFLIGMIVVSLMIAITFVVYTFLRWYYNVGIVTDKRVLDLDFHNIMSHSLAEARLEKIVDVTHKQKGSISDLGDVYIQTGGSSPEIVFTKIPRPREVQNILHELLEGKKKGEV